ncbi:MAG TPA: hypothetical protein VGH97_09470, partial [Thermoanaerobaculia bacterium]
MGHVLYRSAVLVLAAALVSGVAQAESRRSRAVSSPGSTERPETFGVVDYTVTSLSDLAFTPFDNTLAYTANPDDYFRYVTNGGGGSFVTGAVIPTGAVIDWIGLGSCDTAGAGFTVLVYEFDDAANFTQVTEFDSTAHDAGAPCGTDFNAAALGYEVDDNSRHTIQVEVAQNDTAATDGTARFSSVEIWWHRQVSPAPGTATFNDVPTDHPFFQYIEA